MGKWIRKKILVKTGKIVYNVGGGISIFLVVILVPILALTSIFIDVSRIELAKGVAMSSADLALNSVMSRYDVQLADYYGMMASCQNVDEFYDVAEEYFTACMVSQGVNTTDAQIWGSQITKLFRSGGYQDLLGIDMGVSTAEIRDMENGNLNNAAMVKAQVLDFMKYRAPIDLTGDILEGNKGFVGKLMGVKDRVKVMPIEADVQNKKTQYYLKENELLQACLEVYEILKKYEEMGLDDKFLNEMKSLMRNEEDGTGIEKDFRNLHERYVTYLANTDGKVETMQSAEEVLQKEILDTDGWNSFSYHGVAGY